MTEVSRAQAFVPDPHHSRRVRTALDRAGADARAFEQTGSLAAPQTPASTRPPASLRVAMGDPQAPLSRVLEVLDRHDLLGDDGSVHPDADLISMGDHFDWGPPHHNAFAAASGLGLLAWLAGHRPEQVSILVGNHDLARVGELAPFDDATFAAARAEARALRATPMHTPGRAERRHAFLERHPTLPSVGVAVRDLAAFETAQRRLVAAMLRAGRFRAAIAAAPDLLLIHAGITPDDLDAIGYPAGAMRADAPELARALGDRFDAAIAAWDGASPFTLAPLYRPGSYEGGEARGVFIQRPADPAVGELPLFEGPPRRRFDPRILTSGLTQVTGHIRDNKCRELMPVWSEDEPAHDGPLRHLWTDGCRVRYRRGLPEPGDDRGAFLLFTDGGMNHVPPADYELLDLGTRRALPRGGA